MFRSGSLRSTPGGSYHPFKVQAYSNTYLARIDTVWLYVYPPVGVEEDPAGIPLATKVEQNYPNLFNPSTGFEFRVPSSDGSTSLTTRLVTLKVYDVLGREVATLVNGVKKPGTYTVQWDATKLASGVYFYRLQAGEFSASQRMILMK